MAKKKYEATDDGEGAVEMVKPKQVQVVEVPNSDYINTGLDITELSKYNLKSIFIYKGRNTIIETYKEVS